jgi:hypothetical protein
VSESPSQTSLLTLAMGVVIGIMSVSPSGFRC